MTRAIPSPARGASIAPGREAVPVMLLSLLSLIGQTPAGGGQLQTGGAAG